MAVTPNFDEVWHVAVDDGGVPLHLTYITEDAARERIRNGILRHQQPLGLWKGTVTWEQQ